MLCPELNLVHLAKSLSVVRRAKGLLHVSDGVYMPVYCVQKLSGEKGH